MLGMNAGIFSIGYLIFQVPSNLIITKVGAPTWLSFIIFCWGIVAAATSAMKDKAQFYAGECCLDKTVWLLITHKPAHEVPGCSCAVEIQLVLAKNA